MVDQRDTPMTENIPVFRLSCKILTISHDWLTFLICFIPKQLMILQNVCCYFYSILKICLMISMSCNIDKTSVLSQGPMTCTKQIWRRELSKSSLRSLFINSDCAPKIGKLKFSLVEKYTAVKVQVFVLKNELRQ